MAYHSATILLLIFLLLIPISYSLNPILPKAGILQVTKDTTTLQYVTTIFIGQKNISPVKLVLDLNSPSIWTFCDTKTPQNPIKTCSLQCSMAKSIKSCHSKSTKHCTLQVQNTVTKFSTHGEINEGKMGIEFWDGEKFNSFAQNDQFLYTCVPNFLSLKGLANGAKGMLGLGRSRISLPSQFSSTFGFFGRKFSLCLSHLHKGAIFLGGQPLENEMMYTPLLLQEEGYYVNVNSIKISDQKLNLSKKEGSFLGAKISTIVPYTTLESKIFAKFVEGYVKAAIGMNLSLVPSVAPFEACFESKGVANVPIIDLVLQSEMVKWRIFGENSMVHVSDEVMCLGVLDGGLGAKDAIVIGGYQLEDYLLEFNLGNSMLGFTSLSMGEKKCSGFVASDLSREVL